MPDQHIPELTDRQREEAERRTSVRAAVVHEAIRVDGETELLRPASALAWSGFAAGMSMAFSLIAEAILRRYLPDQPWRPLVTRLGYPIGFLIVILGKQQLFTENTLTVIIPLMSRRDRKTLMNVARLWVVVLVANIAGAHAIAWILTAAITFDAGGRMAMLDTARDATSMTALVVLVRGIFAGWLIATVVWLRAAVDSGEAFLIFLLTWLVGAGSFAHVIVGSVESLTLVFAGERSWPQYFTAYFVPSLVGNIIGGVSLVAALNHAQVVSGQAMREE